MASADQFTGMDMKDLIGRPPSASADKNVQLVLSTTDFINSAGLDEDKKYQTVDSDYKKKIYNEDGSIRVSNVKAPFLTLVPIPNLQMDASNIYVDIKITESSSGESASGMGRPLSPDGSIPVHEKDAKSSDHSAKYQVDVTAAKHETPEGLARIQDMFAANAVPNAAGSTDADKNGDPLSGE
jgi:hypothetical protein